MLTRQMIIRILAIAGTIMVVGASAGMASASSRLQPATRTTASTSAESKQGPKMTGTITFKQFIPYGVQDQGQSLNYGGDTQSGTIDVDMMAVQQKDEYGTAEWVSVDSRYNVTDKVSEGWDGPGCTSTVTASGTASGELTSDPSLTRNIGVAWGDSKVENEVDLGVQVAKDEVFTFKDTGGGPNCPVGDVSTTEGPVYIIPTCADWAGPGGGGFYGLLDMKTDTIRVDCSGDDNGQTYSVKGTLHVDPYMFVLPRWVKSESQWKTVLAGKHHDHASIDIPVPVGTPYYAITAGRVTFTSGACGDGVTLHGLDGVTYTYCHGSWRAGANGYNVGPGQLLGFTGNTDGGTNTSTGPHLHVQIKYGGHLRCPQTLLWDLYDLKQPPPDEHTVQTLPTSGCIGPPIQY
jgi:peptidase M23-like protein